MNPTLRNLERPDTHGGVDKTFLIYVVEDSDIYRELLSKFINDIDNEDYYEENKRYTIRSFRTGEECLAAIEDKPDIVVLDYFLNGYTNSKNSINGLAALREIKRRSPETHVVIVSSQGDFRVTSQLYQNGASDYISKEPGIRERIQSSLAKLMRGIEHKENGTTEEK
jgi:CheY-like chemotaxis protein